MAIDISKLPPPPGAMQVNRKSEAVDISALPPPPVEFQGPDISRLPPPPQVLEKAPQFLTREDFRKLGDRFGVDPDELRAVAPYFNADVAPESLGEAGVRGLKSVAGFLGSAVGFNIPQFAYKKLQEPNMRAALDEIQRIAEEQSGPLDIANELIMPTVGIPKLLHRGGRIAETVMKVAEGFGLAGVSGAARAPEGQELEVAKEVMTHPLTVGLVSAGVVLPKLLSYKSGKVTSEEQKLIDTSKIDLGRGVDDIAARTAESEKLIDDLILGKKDALTQAEADRIVRQQMNPEALDTYLNASSDNSQVYRREAKASRGPNVDADSAVIRNLADDIVEQRTRDFAEELTRTRPRDMDEALSSIEKYQSRQGIEATMEKYNAFRQYKQAEKFIEETGTRITDQPGFFGRALNNISDNQFVLRHIDRFGTNLEGDLALANKNFNRSTYALSNFRNEQDQIFKLAKAVGVDPVVVNTDKIYNALDTGNMSQLSEQEAQVAQGFRKYFDNLLGFVNGSVKSGDPSIAPLNIPRMQNYVPKSMKSIPEVIGILEAKQQSVLQKASQATGLAVKNLGQLSKQGFNLIASDPEVQELIRFVKMFDPKPITSPQELSSRLKELMYSRDGNISLETKARAAMERTGEIPEYLLEKNLYKLTDKYTANTLRHLYMRNPLDRMKYQAKAIARAGGDVEAKYVNNLIQDVLGVRKGTAAEAFLQARIQSARTLDRMIQKYGKDSVAGGILTVAKAIPEGFQSITRNIYPNVLGYWNLRAVIQNSTSALTKLWPELGVKYGTPTVLRGAAYTVLNFRKLLERARSGGNIPAEFSRKGQAAIAEGIARSSLYRIPKDVLDGMGRAGMILYQKMEEFNRALTMGTADMMAHDLARGSKAARDAASKFPRSLQKSIQAAGSQEEVSKLLGQYLNSVTQYNYNRVSLSEFGRMLGPIFSTFSKWPTATAGDIIHEFRSKSVLQAAFRNAEKYIAPFLVLQGMDMMLGEGTSILGEEVGGDGLSDTQKKLLGTYGLSQSAPIGAVKAIATGEIFSPPVVDAAMQGFLVPLMEGDMSKLRKGLSSSVSNFAPGAGLFRFITDDLVTYATGERPEGSNFIERTESGIRKLNTK